MQESEPKLQNSIEPSLQNKKYIVFSSIIVGTAVACFGLTIFAMSSAVNFFSYMFTLTTELIAKSYLQVYYSWYMSITYMAIFGCVVVLAATPLHFTQFTQKQGMIWIHGLFYLSLVICGIVALLGNQSYKTKMITLASSSNCTDFECQIAPSFVKFRSNVTVYFIGYCISFLVFSVFFHYVSYSQRKSRQQKANLGKIIGRINQMTGDDFDNRKDIQKKNVNLVLNQTMNQY